MRKTVGVGKAPSVLTESPPPSRAPGGAGRRSSVTVYGLIVAVGVMSLAFGETIEINQGLGVDGVTYGAWARDFTHEVVDEGITGYQAQRVLPSAVVHYSLRLLRIDPTTDTIVTAFKIFNFALLLLTLALWLKTAALFRLPRRTQWLGFLLMFGSLAVLKVTFYYPVLTDTTALVLGMGTLWAYFSGRRMVLLVLTVLGSFTWPIVVYFGLWLVLFPFDRSRLPDAQAPEALGDRVDGRRRSAPLTVAAAASACFVLVAWYLHYYRRLEIVTYNHIDSRLVPVSLVIVVAYLMVVLSKAAEWLPDAMRSIRRTEGLVPRAAGVLGALVLLRLAVGMVASSDPAGSAYTKRFVEAIVLTPIQRPGVFFVAHVTYFGVLPILILLFWKPFIRTLTSLGVGVAFLGFLNLVLALVSESRGLMFIMPLFVTVLVLSTRDFAWTKLQYGVIAVSALALSKVWLPRNSGQPCDPNAPQDLIAHVCTLRYFMNLGPWMKHGPYVVHLVATVLATALLFFVVRARSRQDVTLATVGRPTVVAGPQEPPVVVGEASSARRREPAPGGPRSGGEPQ